MDNNLADCFLTSIANSSWQSGKDPVIFGAWLNIFSQPLKILISFVNIKITKLLILRKSYIWKGWIRGFQIMSLDRNLSPEFLVKTNWWNVQEVERILENASLEDHSEADCIFVAGQLLNTVCPRSSDLFYIVIYYIKWVTTSWTHGMCPRSSDPFYVVNYYKR